MIFDFLLLLGNFDGVENWSRISWSLIYIRWVQFGLIMRKVSIWGHFLLIRDPILQKEGIIVIWIISIVILVDRLTFIDTLEVVLDTNEFVFGNHVLFSLIHKLIETA